MTDEGLSVTGRRMVGYALKWGKPAFIRKGAALFEERFSRGAFASSIAAGEVVLASNHDQRAVVARQDNGSLILTEDDLGLRVDAWAADSEEGDAAIHDARCRSRAGLSVCFTPIKSEWIETKDGRIRIITAADLWEVSVVRNPAYRSSELHAGLMRIAAFEAGYGALKV